MNNKERIYATPKGPVWGIEAGWDDIAPWRATPATLREAVFGNRVTGLHHGRTADSKNLKALEAAPTNEEVSNVLDMVLDAVSGGRLFDMGYLPNRVIQNCAKFAGPLYHAGALPHPFPAPWMFMHDWEGGVVAYLVAPSDDISRGPGVECAACELQPTLINNQEYLLMQDRAVLWDSSEEGFFNGLGIPSPMRFIPGMEEINSGKPPAEACFNNVLDPVMTCLSILHTRGVPRETVSASRKLQKKRKESGKRLIPSYEKIHVGEYVTAILANRAGPRVHSEDGTRASPHMHLRRAHGRTFPDGHRGFIQATLVKATPEALAAWQAGKGFKSDRTHYEVRP